MTATLIRGTTPTITCTINEDLTGWTCFFSIGREGTEWVTVSNDQMELEVEGGESKLSVTLTQAQTLALKKGAAKAQFRAVDGDVAVASKAVEVLILDIIKEGEIEDVY